MKPVPAIVAAILISCLALTSALAGDWDRVNSREFHDDAVPASAEYPPWFKTTFHDLREDLADAKKSGKRGVLLFLTEAHCSYCKMMMTNTFGQPDIRERLTRHFDVVGLEVIGDIELTDPNGLSISMKQFVIREKAYVTPTLIFFGTGGQRILQIAGYYPPARFRHVLDYVIDGHAARRNLSEFLAAREATSSKSRSKMPRDPQLFSAPPYKLDRRAAVAKRPLLVLFERPNCAACVRFHRRVLNDPDVRGLIRRFEAIQIDTSDGGTSIATPDGQSLTGQAWARQLRVTDTPTLVFFDERGREVFRLESELLRMRTAGAMQLVLDKAYLDEPQLQRWRNRRAIEARQHQGRKP